MNLREKTFANLGLTLVALVLVMAGTISFLTLRGLRELEDQKIVDHMTRIKGYLANERERLEFLTSDWGCWDETYNFVLSSGDPGYPERNLSPGAIANFDANLIMFVALDGRIAWGARYDLVNKVASEVPASWLPQVLIPPLLMKADHTSGAVSISMVLEGRAYLFSAGPVLKSDYSGPAVGSIIFARELDPEYLAVMRNRLRLNVNVQSGPEFEEKSLAGMVPYRIGSHFFNGVARTKDLLHVFFTEPDAQGHPAFVVEYEIVRDIYRQGKRQLLLMLAGILASATVVGFVFWRLLTRNILDRLGGISGQLRRIQTTADVKTSIRVPGDDELGELGREMNGMLEAIRQQRQLSETYLNVARVMIGALDAHGRVTMINPRGCDMLGFRREEILGMDWFANFIPVRLRSELTSLYGKLMYGEIELIRFYENQVVTRSGQELLLSFHNELLRNPGGRIDGLIFSAEDITDRRRREEEQSRLEKLESLGLMAGGIAHDFNNTLTAIMANIELLKSGSSVPESERPEIIKDALDGTQRARELTMQLLTFAKGGEPVREIIHLGDLIRNSVRFALRGSDSRQHIDIEDKLWPVSVDITQMTQVILNIVINADHAMPGGGVVHVRALNSEVRANSALPLKPGSYVVVEVSDEGHGIPQEDLNRIFDPYFTTKEAGSGLGLSTAFSVVRRHGGHITVQSTVGAGSTFRVYIPAIPGAVVSASERLAEKSSILSGLRVLVVDDDDVILRVIRRILAAQSCSVELAENSAQALEKTRQAQASGQPFELAIMDLVMPGDLGGLATLAKLRELDPGLKAIVASGYSNDPVLSDPGRFGFARAVSKPFEPAELLQAIVAVTRE